nr:energy transducer TonB [Pseudomonas sp. S25]
MIGWFSTAASAGDTLLIPVSQAATSYPKPIYLPSPKYPATMFKDKEGGSVTVRIFIHANGSVTFKEVVKASDSRLADAVKKVIPEWRFAAWTPPADKPDGESSLVSYNFDAKAYDTNLVANIDLKKRRCSQLNNELIWTRHSHSVKEAKTFRDTRDYLLNGAVIREFVTEEERQALIDDFDLAIPAIIEGCRKRPRAFYADFLPAQMRAML